MYDDRREPARDYGSPRGGSGRLYSEDRTHPSRHAALPNAQYTNFYAGPKAPNPVQSKLPLFIAGGVIVVLLIIVLAFAFGGKGDDTKDASTVPITGITDTTQSGEGSGSESQEPQQQAKPTETAPTKVTVEYKVASGQNIWAIITTDGTAEDQMIAGPVTETVDVTGTWSIATWVTDAVKVTVDGEAVGFDGTDASGIPQCTVDFAAYLEQWKADHPDAAAATAGTGADDAGGGTAGGAGSGASSTE